MAEHAIVLVKATGNEWGTFGLDTSQNVIIRRAWTIVFIASLHLGLTMPIQSSAAVEPQKPAQLLADDVLRRVIATRHSLPSLYVEYELFVLEGGRRSHKLSVVEAMDNEHFYSRIVHWYDQSLYRFRNAKDDPFLNSYLWSKKGRIQTFETVRKVVISPGTNRSIVGPSIERYFGYIGLLTPERSLESDVVGIGYTAKEYYLPHALTQGEWCIDSERDNNSIVTLVCDNSHVIDRVTVDTSLGGAVRERHIRFKDDTRVMHISGAKFTEVAPGIWLPMEISATSVPTQTLLFRCSTLTAEIPDGCFEPTWPGGSIVVDDSENILAIVPGGNDLLDFTIDRMRLAAAYAERNSSYVTTRLLVSGVLLVAILFCMSLTIALSRRRTPT